MPKKQTKSQALYIQSIFRVGTLVKSFSCQMIQLHYSLNGNSITPKLSLGFHSLFLLTCKLILLSLQVSTMNRSCSLSTIRASLPCFSNYIQDITKLDENSSGSVSLGSIRRYVPEDERLVF